MTELTVIWKSRIILLSRPMSVSIRVTRFTVKIWMICSVIHIPTNLNDHTKSLYITYGGKVYRSTGMPRFVVRSSLAARRLQKHTQPAPGKSALSLV